MIKNSRGFPKTLYLVEAEDDDVQDTKCKQGYKFVPISTNIVGVLVTGPW